MLVQCWDLVCDAGPTINQYWSKIIINKLSSIIILYFFLCNKPGFMAPSVKCRGSSILGSQCCFNVGPTSQIQYIKRGGEGGGGGGEDHLDPTLDLTLSVWGGLFKKITSFRSNISPLPTFDIRI